MFQTLEKPTKLTKKVVDKMINFFAKSDQKNKLEIYLQINTTLLLLCREHKEDEKKV